MSEVETPDYAPPESSSKTPEDTEWILHIVLNDEGRIRHGYFFRYEQYVAIYLGTNQIRRAIGIAITQSAKDACVFETFEDAAEEKEVISQYDREGSKATDVNMLSITPVKYSGGKDQ